MPKISVVIPVYNAEKYLRECLDSVVNQTLKDIEIICVNDGSTDNSLSILEEYATQDNRIKIINKENGGVHTARNIGMERACGNYTIFLDADDFFDLRMFEKLYNKAIETDCDIVACETYDFDDVTKEIAIHNSLRKETFPEFKKIFNWKDCKTLNIINPAPWNKIIKTDFLKETGLKFGKFGPYEDCAFFYSLYAFADSITYIDDILVYYRNNIQGQRSNLNPDSFFDMCNVFENVIDNCKKLSYFDEIKNLIAACAVEVLIWNINQVIPKNNKKYPLYFNKLHEIFNSEFYKDINDHILDNNYYLISNFQKIKKYEYKKLKNKEFLQSMFSIRNEEGDHKILQILGLKFKFKKTKLLKHIFQKVISIQNKENYKIIKILGFKIKRKSKYLILKNNFYKLNESIQKLAQKKQDKTNDLYVFSNVPIKGQTVLIIEQNDVHSETIPGYAKYFLDLGYNVHVVMPEKLEKEKPFCRFKHQNLKIFHLEKNDFSLYLKLDKIKDYSKIFVSSHILYFWTESWKYFHEYFNELQIYQDKLFFIEHHLELANTEMVKKKKVFALAEFPEFVDKIPMVNPHYFGDINITSNTQGKTNFFVIGLVESFRKNYSLIIDAVQKLVDRDITNFKITHIGRKGILNIPKHLKPYFDLKGYQAFDKLFDELETSDFILPLLDPKNPEHDRYIKNGTSGTFQYVYGFLKPCIIQEKFASVHKFNNENSIIYEYNEDLSSAMETAIKMNQKEYIKLQNNIKTVADQIYNKSLSNLKVSFEKKL